MRKCKVRRWYLMVWYYCYYYYTRFYNAHKFGNDTKSEAKYVICLLSTNYYIKITKCHHQLQHYTGRSNNKLVLWPFLWQPRWDTPGEARQVRQPRWDNTGETCQVQQHQINQICIKHCRDSVWCIFDWAVEKMSQYFFGFKHMIRYGI